MRAGMLLVAVAATGCVHQPGGASGTWTEKPAGMSGFTPGTPAGPSDDLPPKQQAALWINIAEGLERDGKVPDAVIAYEKARQTDPATNDRAARRLAVLYDQVDQQAKAMTEFQALVKKRPKDAGLLSDLGYSYYNRGQWAEAETHLRRAVAADKANKRAWVNLGLALAQQGKTAEALEAFKKGVGPAEAHQNLAFVLVTQGKKAEAAAEYRAALAIEPALTAARAALDRLEGRTAAAPRPAVQPAGGAAAGS